MRSLRLLKRNSTTGEADAAGPGGPARSASVRSAPWNTLYTLGSGAVADIDARGAIHPRGRALSVEIWFGVGDRWLRGTSADGVRQRRVDGLPVIETRQRVGDDDLVQTAWADDAGAGLGRVVVELSNGGSDPVIAAVVVRPHTLEGPGNIAEVRVADTTVVADRRPLVELGRAPGDVVVAPDLDFDVPRLSDLLQLGDPDGGTRPERNTALDDAPGSMSLAALIPLTPGVDRTIQVVDGREAPTVAPAPLETVVSGWKRHLADASDLDLPGWPDHLVPALVSSLLGASTGPRRAPRGDQGWRLHDDALIVSALARLGLGEHAVPLAETLLDAVVSGGIDRSGWIDVAAAVGSLARTGVADEALARHGEAIAAVAGHALTEARVESLAAPLVRAIGVAHGERAEADALGLSGAPANPDDAQRLARHGWVDTAVAPLDVVAVRASAGSTWRWARTDCGDSPHERAALAIGLASMCVDERAGRLDLVPTADERWLGRSVSVERLPTSLGPLSFAIRWHGERPALLWEFDRTSHTAVRAQTPMLLTCGSLDPGFSSNDVSGEVLLAAPEHLDGGRSMGGR